jgi:hypothetical protein
MNPIARTATIPAVSFSADGTYLSVEAGAGKYRRPLGTAERDILSFVQSAGTNPGDLIVNVIDGHTLEMLLGGKRFTAGLGQPERDIASFLIGTTA